ncbi:hypothetical protein D9758_011673 [Tetrapyrgos nigripes]|uniref:Helicase C-terminal domain-containing protein n=1 Tax=Tetrapyrgos nigripes TaxID=182062 RepID=A0A8H5GDC1_9AGAR|nr:hypothetical protein D9758_011673 [Tetrapyrgos nigripes]
MLVQRDVINKLQISKSDHISIDKGNDRGNVSLVVRPIHNAINSFIDLDFCIPEDVQRREDIPKTFIYYDNIMGSVDMEDHLNTLLPRHLRNEGLVRLYSAGYSNEYRDKVMTQFKVGKVRVLICTDAAEMGCNIPDIQVIVQWKLPGSVSSAVLLFVQQAGCAARGIKEGLAVLLVEKAVYYVSVNALNKDVSNTSSSKMASSLPKEAKLTKKYAENHGLLRGTKRPGGRWTKGSTRLYKLVNFVKELTVVFGNEPAAPTVPCCDICNPELLDRVCPGEPKISKRKPAIPKSEEPYLEVQQALHDWRKNTQKLDPRLACLASEAILDNSLIDLLSSVRPIPSKARLDVILSGQWVWFNKYGDEVLEILVHIEILAVTKMTLKRKVAEAPESTGSQPAEKCV